MENIEKELALLSSISAETEEMSNIIIERRAKLLWEKNKLEAGKMVSEYYTNRHILNKKYLDLMGQLIKRFPEYKTIIQKYFSKDKEYSSLSKIPSRSLTLKPLISKISLYYTHVPVNAYLIQNYCLPSNIT